MVLIGLTHYLSLKKNNTMKLFEELWIKFKKPDWSRDIEIGLTDTILEQHPHILFLLQDDTTAGTSESIFGKILPG